MYTYHEEDFTWLTPERIAQNYKEARIRSGLTQRKLAEKIGVKPNQVSRWENAKARPTVENFKKIVEVLTL